MSWIQVDFVLTYLLASKTHHSWKEVCNWTKTSLFDFPKVAKSSRPVKYHLSTWSSTVHIVTSLADGALIENFSKSASLDAGRIIVRVNSVP